MGKAEFVLRPYLRPLMQWSSSKGKLQQGCLQEKSSITAEEGCEQDN